MIILIMLVIIVSAEPDIVKVPDLFRFLTGAIRGRPMWRVAGSKVIGAGTQVPARVPSY